MRAQTHTHTLLLLLFFIRYAWLCRPAPAPMGRRSGGPVGFWQLPVTMGPNPEPADASTVSFSSDVTLACYLSSLLPGLPISKWRTISVREHGGTAFWGPWHQRRIPILPGFSHLTETPEHPGMSLQSVTTNVNKWSLVNVNKWAPGRWRPKSNSLNFPDLWLKHQLFSPPLTHTTLIP